METKERIEQTFVVEGISRLSISNVRGSITVGSDERDDIQVTAIKRLDSRGDPERTEIQMCQEGDHVVVKTRYQDDEKWLARLRGDRVCTVDYAVQVPSHCSVEVKQVKGVVHVSGVTGRVKVNAVEGAVELHEIDGRTQVNAVSAKVEGGGWRGRAQVATVSGPVRISGAQLSRLKANTVSGDLSLETTVDERGRYDFRSISGDVTFYLPPEQGVVSRGATISGRLRCDLPHDFTRHGRAGWRATINGGGPPVRFSSVSGDLEFETRTFQH